MTEYDQGRMDAEMELISELKEIAHAKAHSFLSKRRLKDASKFIEEFADTFMAKRAEHWKKVG